MNLTVNGDAFYTEKEKITLIDLLKEKKVEQPELVSVQVNGCLVKKLDYMRTLLNENDDIDFLYFMGGGVR
jgi:sulfur carrier protein